MPKNVGYPETSKLIFGLGKKKKKKKKKDRKTKRTEEIERRLREAGLSEEEIKRLRGKKKG
ncbi:hypothetical protein LCGC14_2435270 [marine sediment metagenome]|uniref:Uncharacterized protein n=1 Tax=marine sediment metagenome TaxID=412755 RepID=A0A0F9DXP5_9ZZZZ